MTKDEALIEEARDIDMTDEDYIKSLNKSLEEARKTYREGMRAFGEMMLASLKKRLAEEKNDVT